MVLLEDGRRRELSPDDTRLLVAGGFVVSCPYHFDDHGRRLTAFHLSAGTLWADIDWLLTTPRLDGPWNRLHLLMELGRKEHG